MSEMVRVFHKMNYVRLLMNIRRQTKNADAS